MISLILSAMFAVHGSPLDPGSAARAPQLAANSSTVALTFGAGTAIYLSASHDGG